MFGSKTSKVIMVPVAVAFALFGTACTSSNLYSGTATVQSTMSEAGAVKGSMLSAICLADVVFADGTTGTLRTGTVDKGNEKACEITAGTVLTFEGGIRVK